MCEEEREKEKKEEGGKERKRVGGSEREGGTICLEGDWVGVESAGLVRLRLGHVKERGRNNVMPSRSAGALGFFEVCAFSHIAVAEWFLHAIECYVQLIHNVMAWMYSM